MSNPPNMARPRRTGGLARLKRLPTGLFRSQESGLLFAVLGFALVISLVNPVFLEPGNLIAILRTTAFTFIVATATTFMLVGGGLDLSVGSVFAGGGIVSAMVLLAGAPIPVAMAAGIGTGALVGIVNAILVVRVGIPALIVTLAMIYIARGSAQVVTGGGLVAVVNPTFEAIGRGSLFGIPFLVLYSLAIGLVAHVVLEHTRYGYHVRAVGGNREAARAAGIRVGLVSSSLYVITGSAAALAGTLMAARLSTGDPNIGQGFEISVISAAIIGGTSLFGGIGTIPGTALGSILLGMMTNGLVIMGVDPLMQNVFVGIVILAAVFTDLVRRRRNARDAADQNPQSES